MEEKKDISRGLIISCIIIVILIGSIIGFGFYIYYNSPEKIYQETLNGGNLSLSYVDDENLFFIENAIPTSDMVGKVYDSADLFYDFTVNVDIDEANFIEYDILLVKDEHISNVIDGNIKIYLEKEVNGNYIPVSEPKIYESNVINDKIGNSIMLAHHEKVDKNCNTNYRLRMWLSDTAVFDKNIPQKFGVKISLKGKAK